MRSFITSIAALVMLAVTVTSPVPARAAAQHATAGTVRCAVTYIIGTQACYAPAQVAVAEKQSPIAVRPSAAVARILRLSLAQVMTHQTPAGTHRDVSISYLYGVLRSDYGRAPGNPTSLIITEYPQRYLTFSPRYTRIIGSARFEISQAALDHPYRPYGPWYVEGNFAHRQGSFTITANVTQDRLLQLASALRREG